MRSIRRGNAADEFPQQVRDLEAWVSGAALPRRPSVRGDHARIRRGPTRPELWILGSSDYGARLAAHFGLPYAFAYFFSDGRGVEEALHLYRSKYRPSAAHPAAAGDDLRLGAGGRHRRTKRGTC